jgi:hypothetical protein
LGDLHAKSLVQPWHQVVRFEVFIHMPLLEDYTAAENNL